MFLLVLRVLGVELFCDVFCRAFARGGVDVHGGGDVGVAEGVLEVLRLDFFFDGDCGVALTQRLCCCGDADGSLVVGV